MATAEQSKHIELAAPCTHVRMYAVRVVMFYRALRSCARRLPTQAEKQSPMHIHTSPLTRPFAYTRASDRYAHRLLPIAAWGASAAASSADSAGTTNARSSERGSTLLPIAGNWFGSNDGFDGVGVYSAETGTFMLKGNLTAGPPDSVFRFGPVDVTARPIAGDWEGTGTTSVGLYYGSTGTVVLRLDANRNVSYVVDALKEHERARTHSPPPPPHPTHTHSLTHTHTLPRPSQGTSSARLATTGGPLPGTGQVVAKQLLVCSTAQRQSST
jgi:hypothetical protein